MREKHCLKLRLDFLVPLSRCVGHVSDSVSLTHAHLCQEELVVLWTVASGILVFCSWAVVLTDTILHVKRLESVWLCLHAVKLSEATLLAWGSTRSQKRHSEPLSSWPVNLLWPSLQPLPPQHSSLCHLCLFVLLLGVDLPASFSHCLCSLNESVQTPCVFEWPFF